MKQLALIKQTSAIHLGHLYEHIFCTRARTVLRENHLYPQLDYTLDGCMFNNGVIYIDLKLYTDSAVKFADQISNLDVTFDNQTMGIAAGQLIAEEEAPLRVRSPEAVQRALEDLHAQPWKKLDDVSVIAPVGIRRQSGVFGITEGKPQRARIISTTLLLDPGFAVSHRELAPLFRQLAWLITASLQDVLVDTFGFYSISDSFKNTRKQIGLANTFKVPHGDDVDLDDVLATCQEVTSDLQTDGAFDRLMSELHSASHFHQPDLAPNPERSFRDTGVFIGSKGWKQTATEVNCNLLLEHMSIEARYGRERVAHSIL